MHLMMMLLAQVDWVTDYEAGIKKAKEEGKTVLLYLGHRECAPDQILRKTVFQDRDFAAATKDLVAIRIERGIGAEAEIERKYPPQGDASIFVFLKNGSELARIVDATGKTLSTATWTGLARDFAGPATLKGRLEYKDVSGGAWILKVGGVTYDLHGDLSKFQAGDEVVVTGRVRRDKVCIHQVGIVFEVESIRK
jgi:hypothetical protein